MKNDQQFSISPKTGRLRKRVRLRYKRKKPIISKKRLKKIGSNPLLILLIIALFALVTYYFMPNFSVYKEKHIYNDDATHAANKRIKENSYEQH